MAPTGDRDRRDPRGATRGSHPSRRPCRRVLAAAWLAVTARDSLLPHRAVQAVGRHLPHRRVNPRLSRHARRLTPNVILRRKPWAPPAGWHAILKGEHFRRGV